MKKYCPVWFLGSAGASPAVSRASRDTSPHFVIANGLLCRNLFLARRQKLRARRPRSPELLSLILLVFVSARVGAQDAITLLAADQQSALAQPVVVSATRFDIPLDQSPASVSVVDSRDLDQRQI